jgi:hypothetical protein
MAGIAVADSALRKSALWRHSVCVCVCVLSVTIEIHSKNPIGDSPFWEANRSSSSRETPRILLNPKVHYHIHNSPPPSLSWARSIQSMPPSDSSKIHFNIIHWSPFVTRFVYNKPKAKCMHSSTTQNNYLTRTIHNCISVKCILNWNASVTGNKQKTIGFPQRKQLPRSPWDSSVSINTYRLLREKFCWKLFVNTQHVPWCKHKETHVFFPIKHNTPTCFGREPE